MAFLICAFKNVDFPSKADDITLCTEHDSADQVISIEIRKNKWKQVVSGNQMKTNPDKCHLLLNNSCEKEIKIGDFEIIRKKSYYNLISIIILSLHHIKMQTEKCML